MAAARWAAALYADVSTAPDAAEAVPILEKAMIIKGLKKGDLSNLDDATACELWRAFVRAEGLPDNHRIALSADGGPGNDARGITRGETCQDGTFVTITVQSVDAADPDRAEKIEEGIRLLLNAADQVPTAG